MLQESHLYQLVLLHGCEMIVIILCINFINPYIQEQSKARVFQLNHSLKSLGRSVGRRNRSSIAHQVVKDSRVRKKVVERMGKLLSQELTTI